MAGWQAIFDNQMISVCILLPATAQGWRGFQQAILVEGFRMAKAGERRGDHRCILCGRRPTLDQALPQQFSEQHIANGQQHGT